jgi:putative ABC transport system permease protein
MKNDLRFALRQIAAHRWFSLAVIVTLALGIGANTAVFTLVNAVLFKPVPLPGGERLMTIDSQLATDKRNFLGVSYPDLRDYRAHNHTFEGIGATGRSSAVISEHGNPPEEFTMSRVSADLFPLLHTPPALGRGFTPDDEKPGAPTVVLISHRVWTLRYGGSPAVLGRAVRLNGLPATIIGVMPAGFHFPDIENVWVPLVPNADIEKRSNRWLHLVGLLKPGVSVAQANEDLGVIAAGLARAYPDTNRDVCPVVRTFHDAANGGQIRTVFLTMLAAVGFVLLIACANVANLMLGRAIARRRELSVRVALGASRGRIVRQLLTECVLLSSLGGLLGLGLSAFAVHAFDLATRPESVGKPYWIVFSMDYRAYVYFAAISVLSGIAFGLAPALRASRVDLNTALKDDTPGAGSRRGHRLSHALVVLQFALAVVLLAGAGLMMRSFYAMQTLNAFVPAERILTARVQLPDSTGEHYADEAARRRFGERLEPLLAALPGVTHAAIASFLPGEGAGTHGIEIEGRPNPDPKKPPQASFVVQTPDYLTTIGLPILLGRGFTELDGAPGHEAAVVTREFATHYWPGQSAVGRRFRYVGGDKPGAWLTVVGVCADLVQNPRNPEAPPLIFVPYRQEPWAWMALLIRTAADPAALTGPLRAAVQQIDPDLPLYQVATLPGALEQQRWFLRVFGTLFLSFALIGLSLAAVGIYAVVAQSTARRTREIGIRMALGATAGRIARLVLARGLSNLLLGLGLGLAGAWGATSVMAKGRLIVRVSPRDPATFIGITVLLLAIGLLACWLPARRAARLAPTEALRSE